MQKGGLKILIIVLIALTPILTLGNNPLLTKADSLFQQKRYTQSYEIYRSLFEAHLYSPAMLLKMAYIQEGLDRISSSAYYLNLYYLATYDESVATKLEELAAKHKLEGYTSTETGKLFSLYQQYTNRISLALACVALLLLLLCLALKFRFKIKPVVAWSLFALVSVALLAHLNLAGRHTQAIIVNSNTYLMDKPSAGSSVIAIVRDGHRVEILGRKDVWLKVSWGDAEVYIKENNVLPIKL